MAGREMTCTATASDPDGTIASYSWAVMEPGSEWQYFYNSGPTLKYTWKASGQGTIAAKVIDYDGAESRPAGEQNPDPWKYLTLAVSPLAGNPAAAQVVGGNRLTAYAGDAMEYDDDGNLTRKSRAGFEQVMGWNSLGQLESVATNGQTVRYGYDGFGRRVRQTDAAGAVTRYLYTGDELFAETDGAGNPVREYAYSPGIDRPHSIRTGGQVYYYLLDEPGHVKGLIGPSGERMARYEYGAFGMPEVANADVQQPLRYMARELDGTTGLYYVRNRWYDPELMRFVSADPIGLEGGINLYAYVGNDPVNSTDPYGMEECQNGSRMVLTQLESGNFEIKSVCRQSSGGSTTSANFGKRGPVTGPFGLMPEAMGKIVRRAVARSEAAKNADKTCPTPPPGPGPGASSNHLLSVTIGTAQHHANNPGTPGWFKSMVQSGRPWDFKQSNVEAFESFGNFNYGATGAAAGFTDLTLLVGAGYAQITDRTASLEWAGSFFDDPIDQEWIRAGIKYYRNGCY